MRSLKYLLTRGRISHVSFSVPATVIASRGVDHTYYKVLCFLFVNHYVCMSLENDIVIWGLYYKHFSRNYGHLAVVTEKLL